MQRPVGARGGRGERETLFPEELRQEPRWSSVRAHDGVAARPWTPATDEKLVTLVMHATASGERFPVGVNCASTCLEMSSTEWVDGLRINALLLLLTTRSAGLEVARAVGSSPVECVKRYAMLHDARERYSAVSRARTPRSPRGYPSNTAIALTQMYRSLRPTQLNPCRERWRTRRARRKPVGTTLSKCCRCRS